MLMTIGSSQSGQGFMARALFLTFVALSGAGLAFADYTNQSIKIGAKLGDLGVQEYIGTFSARYTGMVDGWEAEALAKDLRSKDMREHLPASVDGWEMREWNEADRAALFPSTDAPEVPPEFQAVMDENPVLANLQAAGEREARSDEIAETRFYARGDSLVALRLSYRSPQREAGGMQGLAINIIEGNMAAMSGSEGFAVIKGVAYGRETGLFGVDESADGTRVFTGRMGAEVRISVRARASDEEIHALLSSIDYDTLNSMMVRPLGDVGTAAADIPLDAQRAVAEAALAEHRQDLMERARDSEAAIIALGEQIGAGADVIAGEAPPASGGLGGLFGGSGAAAEPDTTVQVRRIGDGNCTTVGSTKRCGVQAD
jgi:hypothetical protein